jgi:hypothetical protein
MNLGQNRHFPLVAAGALALALGLAVAVAAARDVQTLEAVGAAPVDPASGVEPRDAAVRAALMDAVLRVARAMAPPPSEAGSDPPAPDLAEVLGDDPYPFASRFQTIEDRGARRALFGSGSDQALEYVVVVQVDVDRKRVRDRLLAAGLIETPAGNFSDSGAASGRGMRVTLQNLADYAAYERIRVALLDLGVRRAVPEEARPGRMVLLVDGDRGPAELAGSLQRAIPELRITPVDVGANRMTLLVDRVSPGAVAPRASGDSGPIDTRGPNRY